MSSHLEKDKSRFTFHIILKIMLPIDWGTKCNEGNTCTCTR